MWNYDVITWYCALFFFLEWQQCASVGLLSWKAEIKSQWWQWRHTGANDDTATHWPCPVPLLSTSPTHKQPWSNSSPSPSTADHQSRALNRDMVRLAGQEEVQHKSSGFLMLFTVWDVKRQDLWWRRSRDRHGEGVKGHSSMRTSMASSLKCEWKERRKISFNF